LEKLKLYAHSLKLDLTSLVLCLQQVFTYGGSVRTRSASMNLVQADQGRQASGRAKENTYSFVWSTKNLLWLKTSQLFLDFDLIQDQENNLQCNAKIWIWAAIHLSTNSSGSVLILSFCTGIPNHQDTSTHRDWSRQEKSN
jgi:hypothetical protein